MFLHSSPNLCVGLLLILGAIKEVRTVNTYKVGKVIKLNDGNYTFTWFSPIGIEMNDYFDNQRSFSHFYLADDMMHNVVIFMNQHIH